MWRLRNIRDHRRAYSLIVPNGSKAAAAWFSQGILQESRSFSTWHYALRWLEDKLETLQMYGWRLDDRDLR